MQMHFPQEIGVANGNNSVMERNAVRSTKLVNGLEQSPRNT
jgi:hypothetical protein